MKASIILTALALLASTSVTRAGLHNWSGGGVNELWSNPANWIQGAPTAGEAGPVELVFPLAGGKALTNDIPGLTVDTLCFFGSGYTLRGSGGGSLTLRGGQPTTVYCRGVNAIAGSLPVTLQGTSVIDVEGWTNILTLSSVISGPGGFTKVGLGALDFACLNHNTYSGTTTVLRGPLHLDNSSLLQSKTAISGPLVIGDGNPINSPTVRLRAHHQIANSAPVTINANGILYLDGFNDTLGVLTLDDGLIYTDNGPDIGALTFGADVIANNGNSYIHGHVSLGGMNRTVNTLAGGVLFLEALTTDGGGAAGLIKTGPGSLFLTAANTYTGPTLVNQGILTLAQDGEPGSPSAGTVVANGASLRLLDTGIGDEPLTLNGAGIGGDFGALRAEQQSSWSGPVTFATASTVRVPTTNDTFKFYDVLSGAGAFIKTGAGQLWLSSTHTNTHTGGTVVDQGELVLSVGNSGIPIPGPLTVGNALDAPGSARVWPTASHQIADSAAITVHASGRLSLQDQNDTIGSLTLLGGVVDGTTGTWTLGGNILADGSAYSFIRGKLSLGGATRSVNVQEAHLVVEAVISNGGAAAGLVKTGFGILQLKAANTYSGLTTVQGGTLYLTDTGRPGNSDQGTTVTNGATVLLYNHSVDFESLTFAAGPAPGGSLDCGGNSAWNGNLAVFGEAHLSARTAGDSLTLGGYIIGSYDAPLLTTGSGTVRLTGNQDNIYPGPTWAMRGTLLLDKSPGHIAIPGPLAIGSDFDGSNPAVVRSLGSGQIADDAAVTVNRHGLLDLNFYAETIGSLAGSGNVFVSLSTLTTGGNGSNTTFSGVLGGIGTTALIKQGGGRMDLTGTNTCTGKCVVNAGNLFIHGPQPASAVTVTNGAFLNGHGSVGVITVANGIVAPGSDGIFGPGLARLQCKGANFNASTGLWLEFAGTDAGTNYSQLDVTGSVVLGNSLPKLRLWFPSAVSNQFTIIKNDGVDPVVGTFFNLPEGATVTSLQGTQFRISYVGGTGNDVVLTQLTLIAPPQLTGITRLATGQMQLTGSGVPGVTYTVEANFDLGPTNWLNLGEMTALPPVGALQFIDVDAANYPQRFYRFVAP